MYFSTPGSQNSFPLDQTTPEEETVLKYFYIKHSCCRPNCNVCNQILSKCNQMKFPDFYHPEMNHNVYTKFDYWIKHTGFNSCRILGENEETNFWFQSRGVQQHTHQKQNRPARSVAGSLNKKRNASTSLPVLHVSAEVDGCEAGVGELLERADGGGAGVLARDGRTGRPGRGGRGSPGGLACHGRLVQRPAGPRRRRRGRPWVSEVQPVTEQLAAQVKLVMWRHRGS